MTTGKKQVPAPRKISYSSSIARFDDILYSSNKVNPASCIRLTKSYGISESGVC